MSDLVCRCLGPPKPKSWPEWDPELGRHVIRPVNGEIIQWVEPSVWRTQMRDGIVWEWRWEHTGYLSGSGRWRRLQARRGIIRRFLFGPWKAINE